MAARTGVWLTSETMTTKPREALNWGAPLSVTSTVIKFVEGPCASFGVQEKIPLEPVMVAFVGAPGASEKVKRSPSGSEAVFVNVSRLNSLTVRSGIAASAGGLFVTDPTTVRIPAPLDAVCPSGLATVIARLPATALPPTEIFIVMCVGSV